MDGTGSSGMERVRTDSRRCIFRQKDGRIGSSGEAAVWQRGSRIVFPRMERFSACAYAHYLAYGLRLAERKV